jgi:hypothetical protein
VHVLQPFGWRKIAITPTTRGQNGFLHGERAWFRRLIGPERQPAEMSGWPLLSRHTIVLVLHIARLFEPADSWPEIYTTSTNSSHRAQAKRFRKRLQPTLQR